MSKGIIPLFEYKITNDYEECVIDMSKMCEKKNNDMEGQINLEEWQQSINHKVYAGCTGCICRKCLYWWSSRCPYGECWDDHRAVIDQYDKAHLGQPLRTLWSNWDKPGEQAHWCRGGTTYPIHYCKSFVKYNGQQVKTCLKANVSVFQDGYISCGIIDSAGCERCYEEFERRQEWEKT